MLCTLEVVGVLLIYFLSAGKPLDDHARGHHHHGPHHHHHGGHHGGPGPLYDDPYDPPWSDFPPTPALPGPMPPLPPPPRYHFSYRRSVEDVVGLSLARAAVLSCAYAIGMRHMHRPYLYASYLLAALCFPAIVVKTILFRYSRCKAATACLFGLVGLFSWLHVFAARCACVRHGASWGAAAQGGACWAHITHSRPPCPPTPSARMLLARARPHAPRMACVRAAHWRCAAPGPQALRGVGAAPPPAGPRAGLPLGRERGCVEHSAPAPRAPPPAPHPHPLPPARCGGNEQMQRRGVGRQRGRGARCVRARAPHAPMRPRVRAHACICQLCGWRTHALLCIKVEVLADEHQSVHVHAHARSNPMHTHAETLADEDSKFIELGSQQPIKVRACAPFAARARL